MTEHFTSRTVSADFYCPKCLSATLPEKWKTNLPNGALHARTSDEVQPLAGRRDAAAVWNLEIARAADRK